jgi:hypothetical protein
MLVGMSDLAVGGPGIAASIIEDFFPQNRG